jgi:hypothetical protein
VVSATDPHGRNLGFLDPDCLSYTKLNYMKFLYLVQLTSSIQCYNLLTGKKAVVPVTWRYMREWGWATLTILIIFISVMTKIVIERRN